MTTHPRPDVSHRKGQQWTEGGREGAGRVEGETIKRDNRSHRTECSPKIGIIKSVGSIPGERLTWSSHKSTATL